jgi:hypothetical protein
MLKKILLLLIFPNLSFATTCAPEQTELSFLLISENYEIIAFKVLGVNQYSESAIDVEITHKLAKSTIDSDQIAILPEGYSGSYPLINSFPQGSEWVSGINPNGNYYYSFYTCPRALQIQDGIITGTTGLSSLDNLSTGFSIEQLDFALKSYQQGLQAADLVCQSDNSYCDKVRTTYDKHTGVLNLPSVKYEVLGYPAYLNAKMQLRSDGSGSFNITELQGYVNY